MLEQLKSVFGTINGPSGQNLQIFLSLDEALRFGLVQDIFLEW